MLEAEPASGTYVCPETSNRAFDGLRFSCDDSKKRRGRAAHLPPPLLPLPVAGHAHAHQRRHLCLGKLDLLANFARAQDRVNGSRSFALAMRQRFFQGVDQVFAKRAHFISFNVVFSAPASLATVCIR